MPESKKWPLCGALGPSTSVSGFPTTVALPHQKRKSEIKVADAGRRNYHGVNNRCWHTFGQAAPRRVYCTLAATPVDEQMAIWLDQRESGWGECCGSLSREGRNRCNVCNGARRQRTPRLVTGPTVTGLGVASG